MPSVSPQQIPAMTADLGIKVVPKAWAEIPEEFLTVAKVKTAAECSDNPWGHIETSVSTGATPLPRRDGAPIQATNAGQDFVKQGKIRLFSRSMGIVQRQTEGENAQQVIEGLISNFQRTFVRDGKLARAQLYADVLVKGSLTAGDQETFDNSYDNGARPDPYPKFIYDGAPLFGTHATKHAGGSYSNYGTNVLASAGLDLTRTALNKTNAVDERGKRIAIMMNTVIVPQQLQYTIDQLIDSSKDPATANGGSNPFQNKLRRIVLPQLDDADGWYGGMAGEGIVFIDGGVPEFTVEFDQLTKTTWVYGEMRYGCYAEEWRYWYANRTPQS